MRGDDSVVMAKPPGLPPGGDPGAPISDQPASRLPHRPPDPVRGQPSGCGGGSKLPIPFGSETL